jgi:hypothetical protein
MHLQEHSAQRIEHSKLSSMTLAPALARLKSHWCLFLLLALLAGGLVVLLSLYLPPGVDWDLSYRPAALAVLQLRDPFQVPEYRNAPWALLPILPLALLPASVGRAIFFLLSVVMTGYSAQRLGAKPLALTAFLLSPVVMHGWLNANIDWMVLLGFSLPPRWGLFCLAIKPQEGSTVALFWLVEAWRTGKLREVVRVFWPVTLALLISFAIYGFWPTHFGRVLSEWWNASLWPLSIPVGLALAVTALRKRDIRYAMGAAPCLSPYVLFHAWAGALVALAELPAEMLAAVIGLWALVIIRALS